MTDAPMLIAGAGIGGLALATALRRHGRKALLLEERDDLSETGAGITLWPNAGGCGGCRQPRSTQHSASRWWRYTGERCWTSSPPAQAPPAPRPPSAPAPPCATSGSTPTASPSLSRTAPASPRPDWSTTGACPGAGRPAGSPGSTRPAAGRSRTSCGSRR
ncbi:MAG: NAD(P)-binding protein [Actinophytocola sp.]|nr:NAD(P)-binding protein [Actinophytocola sp.]